MQFEWKTYYKMKYSFILFSLLCIFYGCNNRQKTRQQTETKIQSADSIKSSDPEIAEPVYSKSKIAQRLDSLGFINITKADSSIAVELMYTRPDNFTGKVLYKELREAYLHPEALKSLLKAQRLLKELHPGYTLIIYDAARPMSVQQEMWNTVKGTSKYRYVSNPAHGGGLHNYGLAVDLSILNEKGIPLSMGTPVDYMGKKAHITQEEQLVNSGTITAQERKNRQLLRHVMKKAGFRPLPSEWWHFNRYSRQTAKEKYRIIP